VAVDVNLRSERLPLTGKSITSFSTSILPAHSFTLLLTLVVMMMMMVMTGRTSRGRPRFVIIVERILEPVASSTGAAHVLVGDGGGTCLKSVFIRSS